MKENTGTIHIVQGGLWGSEGKGQVAALVAKEKGIKHAVRTGSINAGHNVHIVDKYDNMRKIALQQIPTAVVDKDVMLYIGPAAYISEPILRKELELIKDLTGEDIRHRLYIDHRCGLVSGEDAQTSANANRHLLMGATGKGCSEAIVTKMRQRGRSEFPVLAKDASSINILNLQFVDVSRALIEVLEDGCDVLLEGTQGTLLDFNTGPYPFVTSRGTLPAHWIAEAGLPISSATSYKTNVIIVLRTLPIRVAGFSGPMGPYEVSWAEFLRRIYYQCPEAVDYDLEHLEHYNRIRNKVLVEVFPKAAKALGSISALMPNLIEPTLAEKDMDIRDFLSNFEMESMKQFQIEYPNSFDALAPYIEKTTVTLKPRRLADMDFSILRRSIELSGCDEIWLGFLNYLEPSLAGEQDSSKLTTILNNVKNEYHSHSPSASTDKLAWFISNLDTVVGLDKVTHVSTGPLPKHHIKIRHND